MIFEFLFWLADHFPPTPGSKRLRTAVQLDCIISVLSDDVCHNGFSITSHHHLYMLCIHCVVLQYYKTKLTSPKHL